MSKQALKEVMDKAQQHVQAGLQEAELNKQM